MVTKKSLIPNYWIGKDKKKISCKEKIKVLNNNFEELYEVMLDTYDEAVLLGIDEVEFKKFLISLIKNMKNNLKNV